MLSYAKDFITDIFGQHRIAQIFNQSDYTFF